MRAEVVVNGGKFNGRRLSELETAELIELGVEQEGNRRLRDQIRRELGRRPPHEPRLAKLLAEALAKVEV